MFGQVQDHLLPVLAPANPVLAAQGTAAAYCQLVAAPSGECATAVQQGGDARRAEPDRMWERQTSTKRSYKKITGVVRYTQVNQIPVQYKGRGCPELDERLKVEGEGKRALVAVDVALAKARRAYSLAAAARTALAYTPPPVSIAGARGKNVWRADWEVPGVPTDDAAARHVWASYLAIEDMVECLRAVADPSFREDLARLAAVEALYLAVPRNLLGGERLPLGMSYATKRADAVVSQLEDVTGELALYRFALESQIAGGPLLLWIKRAGTVAAVLAGLSLLRLGWRVVR